MRRLRSSNGRRIQLAVHDEVLESRWGVPALPPLTDLDHRREHERPRLDPKPMQQPPRKISRTTQGGSILNDGAVASSEFGISGYVNAATNVGV